MREIAMKEQNKKKAKHVQEVAAHPPLISTSREYDSSTPSCSGTLQFRMVTLTPVIAGAERATMDLRGGEWGKNTGENREKEL
jgi:hypothetical protein